MHSRAKGLSNNLSVKSLGPFGDELFQNKNKATKNLNKLACYMAQYHSGSQHQLRKCLLKSCL